MRAEGSGGCFMNRVTGLGQNKHEKGEREFIALLATLVSAQIFFQKRLMR
jgi:hypothetical protein